MDNVFFQLDRNFMNVIRAARWNKLSRQELADLQLFQHLKLAGQETGIAQNEMLAKIGWTTITDIYVVAKHWADVRACQSRSGLP